MARVLIALLMMGSLLQAEERISLSLDGTQAAFLPPAAPERSIPLQPIPYTHTDIVIRLPRIPTDYVAFISPSGGLGMMRVTAYERTYVPFSSAVGNALITKPPGGFR
ncbi:MAG: hypothetical protein BGO12_14285 [Verrucomicrobia bacterium 61-8]|nr:hypothetical protein [Verrucomicrobiota bacterium]OJV01377.1 MAG: hypothetical protein BGO12_14285 [Verrucomicrobia bacterium 61-8]